MRDNSLFFFRIHNKFLHSTTFRAVSQLMQALTTHSPIHSYSRRHSFAVCKNTKCQSWFLSWIGKMKNERTTQWESKSNVVMCEYGRATEWPECVVYMQIGLHTSHSIGVVKYTKSISIYRTLQMKYTRFTELCF